MSNIQQITIADRLGTINHLRAKSTLLGAGRYLQNQYNAGMMAGDLLPGEQLALWQAAEILQRRYNELVAN